MGYCNFAVGLLIALLAFKQKLKENQTELQSALDKSGDGANGGKSSFD